MLGRQACNNCRVEGKCHFPFSCVLMNVEGLLNIVGIGVDVKMEIFVDIQMEIICSASSPTCAVYIITRCWGRESNIRQVIHTQDFHCVEVIVV